MAEKAGGGGKHLAAGGPGPYADGGGSLPGAPLGGLKVLVVDDNPLIVSLLRLYLKKFDIVDPLEAADGASALERLNAGDVDLVICDLNMAGMDGIQFLRHLAARQAPPAVILLSGEGQTVLDTAAQLGRAHGLRIVGTVAKPFRLKLLKALLEQFRALPEPGGFTNCALLTPAEIRDGLRDGAIEVAYQPKVSARGGRLVGVEALLRWRRPDGSVISPAAVIPVAESEGLITDITKTVFRKAMIQCGAWQAEAYDISVAVNVSMQDLYSYDFPEFVVETARESGVAPASVVLEVTESQIAADLLRPLEILSRLRLKGVGLAIDDYGTGASSLQRLKRTPATELKIDREFVAGAPDDRAVRAMLTSSIRLGKELGLTVVAEGVETAAEWRLVAARGADVVQGYFVARPMFAGEMAEWLARQGGAAQRHVAADRS